MDMETITSKRLIMISGKGGVGRTTLAAAIAIAAAKNGKRVLLAEVGDNEGDESPLAHLFGKKNFTEIPAQLDQNLMACRLWAPQGHKLFLQHILPGGAILSAALRSKALQAFLTAAPSFCEMGWFYHLLTLIKEMNSDGQPRHQLIIIDMPATGHTLALTTLPKILIRLIRSGPIVDALSEGQRVIYDPDKSSSWVVTLPEKLPVSEALELLEGLHASNVPIGGIFLNRFPQNPFQPDEFDTINRIFNDHNIYGKLSFQRIIRSQEAEKRLLKEIDVPIIKVDELTRGGFELPAQIAQKFNPITGDV
jgi:arsenite-transporting ATPase